jgi:hypothetical protein
VVTGLPQLIKQTKLMEEQLDMDRNSILIKYGFDKHNDARVTIFSKAILVQRSVRLCFIFRRNHLSEPEWWKGLDADMNWSLPSDADSLANLLINYIDEFTNFWTVGYVHALFSSIESSFRLFVRALDPNACNKGAEDFINIYQWLLTKLKLVNYISMLSFLRLVRNTVHNNGVYYHRTKLKESVTYNGKTYTFELGKAVEYGDVWDILQFQIMPDVKRMMADVVNTKHISSIPQIVDPIVI